MAEALLGLGGNVGDVQTTLDRATIALCDGIDVRLIAQSSDYKTPPWGVEDQPAFVNRCIAVDTALTPRALLDRALAVERTFGRDRARERIVLDPGIGFGKTPEQSLTAIARLGRLRAFGLPLLIGLSRKRFINAVVPSAPQDRLAGSIAGADLAVLEGAAIVRVHDVAETVQALRVAAAIRAAR